jgi:hypothetical protein
MPPLRAIDRLTAARAPIQRRDFALRISACYSAVVSMGS